MDCTRCGYINKVKRGVVNGRQRYTCKDCGYHYTVAQKSTSKPDSVKRQALALYLVRKDSLGEGLGFRSIGRILKVSHVSVYNWIKSYGSKLENISSETDIEVVEIDELHTYIGEKKTPVGYGLLLIDMAKDSSISLLATGHHKQESNYGKV